MTLRILRTGATLVAALAGLALVSGCATASDEPRTPASPSASETPPPSNPAARDAEECPEATTSPTTADELEDALADAEAGDVIVLAPGTYEGEFVAEASGTPNAPITLCGTHETIPDGGAIALASTPNPFYGSTRIDYVLPADGDVVVSVHDARGARISTLERRARAAGRHSVLWDGRTESGFAAPAGMYFVHLVVDSDGGSVTRKIKILLSR